MQQQQQEQDQERSEDRDPKEIGQEEQDKVEVIETDKIEEQDWEEVVIELSEDLSEDLDSKG